MFSAFSPIFFSPAKLVLFWSKGAAAGHPEIALHLFQGVFKNHFGSEFPHLGEIGGNRREAIKNYFIDRRLIVRDDAEITSRLEIQGLGSAHQC